MSGFNTDWLALREPADLRARNGDVLGAVVRHFSAHKALSLVDLGCGSGSNLRALAPHLAPVQQWRLVDHDPGLLAAARKAIAAWHEDSSIGRVRTTLNRTKTDLDLAFSSIELAEHCETVLDDSPDLVTAAAFFDLTSADWISRFAQSMATRALPLYAVLTYDGRETWLPPHSADAAVLSAFHAHQARDKGFGPAAGPRAARLLVRAFRDVGYRVVSGDSAWRLEATSKALMCELAIGIAQAVSETELIDPQTTMAWRDQRLLAASCEIGHVDLFACPVAH